MTTEQYLDLLDLSYMAHHAKKESRAIEGTDLHALASTYINSIMRGDGLMEADDPHEFDKLIPFISWCNKNVKRFLFSEIHCFSERLHVGGKTDFGYESNAGEYVLADIKSRDKMYFSDFVQCGAYDLQIQENQGLDKDGNVVWDNVSKNSGNALNFNAHAIFGLGENFKEPVISRETEKNRQAFENCVSLYKLKNEFENK